MATTTTNRWTELEQAVDACLIDNLDDRLKHSLSVLLKAGWTPARVKSHVYELCGRPRWGARGHLTWLSSCAFVDAEAARRPDPTPAA